MKFATVTSAESPLLPSSFRVTCYMEADQSIVSRISVFSTKEKAKNFCTEERLTVIPPAYFIDFPEEMIKLYPSTTKNAKVLSLSAFHPFCKILFDSLGEDAGHRSFILDDNGLRFEAVGWEGTFTGVMTTSRKIGELIEVSLVKSLRGGHFTCIEDLGFEITIS